MKRLLILILVLAVAVGVLGYWRGWFSVNKEDNSVQTDPAKFKQDKEAFSQSVGKKAKAMKDEIDSLWTKSEGATTANKGAVQKELGELKQKHERLVQQIKELEDAGQDRFVSIKKDLEETLAAVDEKIKELTKKLDKA